MVYSNPYIIIGDDVVDRFWYIYLSGNLSSGASYTSGTTSGGTTNFSAANTVTVQYPVTNKANQKTGQTNGTTNRYWFQSDSNFPGSQSQPGSSSAPARALDDITGVITAAGIFNAIKTETQRFTTYNSSVKWYVTRRWQTYTTSGAAQIYGPEGLPYYGTHVATTLYQRAHEQVKARWMTTSQFTFTDPANNIVADVDDVSTDEFNTLFQGFSSNYSSAKSTASSTTVSQSYTQCHNSCHSSCHGSRGRR
jgi:hypothetical protein